jgi:hypothetical protein
MIVKDHGVEGTGMETTGMSKGGSQVYKRRLCGMERRRKAVGAGEIIFMSKAFTGGLYFLISRGPLFVRSLWFFFVCMGFRNRAI